MMDSAVMTEAPERAKWTRERVFGLAVLFGRGRSADDIAIEMKTSPGSVREVCRRFGWAFADRPPGNLMVDLPVRLLDALEIQAIRRRQTPEALASKVLSILAAEPVLLANVLDDEM